MRDDGAWYLKGFRRAQPGSAWRNVGKTFLQTLLFWGLFLGLIPLALRALERDVLGVPALRFAGQEWVGFLGFAMMGALGIWSGVTMALHGEGTPLPLDHPNRLVVRGPYCHVRNPMAIAGLSQAVCVGVAWGVWSCVPYALIGGVLWNALARPPEEHQLERDFGEAYVAYKAQVRCWWPRLRPYSVGSARASSSS